jgi:hypothetical protein
MSSVCYPSCQKKKYLDVYVNKQKMTKHAIADDAAVVPHYPADMRKLAQSLYHAVQIETDRGTTLEGGLVTIDPVSNTAVLLLLVSSPPTVTDLAGSELLLIPAVNWDKMRTLPTDAALRAHLENFAAKIRQDSSPSTHDNDISDIAGAQARLIENFTRHGLKAVAGAQANDNKVIVQDCVTIRPPYRPEDCRATNEIVLERVQKLIKSFATLL